MTRRLARGLPWLLVMAAVWGCGGDGGSAPTAPSPGPPPPPPPAATWTVSGSVRAADEEAPIPNARVELVGGPDAGASVRSDGDGAYRFDGLHEGTHEIRASAEGFEAATRSVSLTRDERVDFALARPAPAPGPPPTPPTRVFAGTLFEGLTDRPIAGATIEADGLDPVTTDAGGAFRLDVPEAQTVREIAIRSSEIVPRITHLRMPGPDAALTAIPGGFDLDAFNQMFRASGQLQRWVTAPHLAIQTAVLQFTDVAASSYVAMDRRLSDDEAELLRADLAWGLPLLTDGRIGFASERFERPAAGEAVTVARTGEIVVARFEGLEEATGFWGYGRWASDGSGRIVAGIVMLDAAFDASGSQFQRSLRVHELGHALGYNHVTTRESVMNASARLVPNEFDLQGARLAFLRPPGNRSPDTDPDQYTSNLRIGVVTWHGDR